MFQFCKHFLKGWRRGAEPSNNSGTDVSTPVFFVCLDELFAKLCSKQFTQRCQLFDVTSRCRIPHRRKNSLSFLLIAFPSPSLQNEERMFSKIFFKHKRRFFTANSETPRKLQRRRKVNKLKKNCVLKTSVFPTVASETFFVISKQKIVKFVRHVTSRNSKLCVFPLLEN